MLHRKFVKQVYQQVELINYIIKLLIFAGLLVSTTGISTPHQSRATSGFAVDSAEIYKQQQCITESLYFEARSEGKEGMLAVMSVIHNRVKSKEFPKSYCKVVHQALQFSYRNGTQPGVHIEIKPIEPSDKQAYMLASSIAQQAALGLFKPVPELSDVLWYHTKSVKPRWSRNMQKVKTISRHVFFKQKEIKKE